MGDVQFAMIIGSLRRDSINSSLAHAVSSLAPRHVSMGASTGRTGAAAAQRHLRAIPGNPDMPAVGQSKLLFHVQEGTFDCGGSFADGVVRGLVSTWLERYLSWVKLHLS